MVNNGMTSGQVKVDLKKDEYDQEAHPTYTDAHKHTCTLCSLQSAPRGIPFSIHATPYTQEDT